MTEATTAANKTNAAKHTGAAANTKLAYALCAAILLLGAAATIFAMLIW